MSFVLSCQDSEKTVSITVASADLAVEDQPFTDFIKALVIVNELSPIDTLAFDNSTKVFTMIHDDARERVVTVIPGSPVTFKTVSGDAWNLQEIDAAQALGASLVVLMAGFGLSALSVSFP